MNKEEQLKQITSLVDKELKSIQEENELKKAIENDKELEFDYRVQNSMKELITDRFSSITASEKIRTKVLNKISPNRKSNFFSFIKEFFTETKKPVVALAFSVILIFFSIYYFNNSTLPTPVEIKAQQIDQNNFYVISNKAFEEFRTGKSDLDILSDSKSEIEKYFLNNEINYSSIIPLFSEWKLTGGMIKEFNNIKICGQLYSNDSSTLLYLLQIPKAFIAEKKLELSDDLMDYINTGKVLRCDSKDFCTYIWEKNNQIFALVSNEEISKIESKFVKF